MTIHHVNHSGKAAILSFLFCGLGQLYNGHIVKGLTIIFFTCLSLMANVFGAVLLYMYFKSQLPFSILWSGIGVLIVGLLSIALIGVYSIVDAHKHGKKHDHQHQSLS